MYRLGLTGSIATGKSTVLEFFKQAGIPVYSADEAVHALYSSGGEAVGPVSALFPGTVAKGAIDRALLAEALVAAPEKLAALEAVVHPLVRKKMAVFLEQAEKTGADLAVLEIPLLFETGAEYPLDSVAVTWCSNTEQRKRALARPGMSVGKLETILERQMPQAEKKKRADYIISTDGTLDDTREQVSGIIADCRRRSEKEPREEK